MVTESVAAGARLAAGGTFEDLFYRPTVLGDVPRTAPAYTHEVFGPVAPIVRFDSIDEAVQLASDSAYGLSLGILTRDVMRGLEMAERIPSGLVHINDQTINDGANAPFGVLGRRLDGAGHLGERLGLSPGRSKPVRARHQRLPAGWLISVTYVLYA